jgi:hypothetical protein
MTIVYISDIETLVKAKMEIDELQLKNENIEEKSKLEDFVNKYAKLKDVFFNKGKIIPFNLVDIYGHKYLFLADENDDISDLLNILNEIHFDFSSLKSASDIDIIQKYGQIEFAQYFYIKGRTCML